MASKDFFLDPDDAQTLGDINYMKKSVVVRHTFPRNLKNPNGFEVVKEVSSREERRVGNRQQTSVTTSFSPVQTKTEPTNELTPKSTSMNTNTSMNMFRNMAKNIRRK